LSAADEAKDEVAGDSDARRERRVVLATTREVDLWVGGEAWLREDVGEPKSAFAEPIAEHGDVAAG
jgi:hypothetical protein